MSSTIAFSPVANASPPFSTTVTLDGTAYLLTCAWNIYRNDWYMTLATQSGTVVVTQPLISSTTSFSINLVYGLFSDTLTYNESTAQFTVTSAS